jgi:hypothetical protein
MMALTFFNTKASTCFNHSDFKALTGFIIAALTDCHVTVINAMMDIAATGKKKNHIPMLI